MIDAFASLRHYAEHLQPVWDALPPEVRGTFWSPSRTQAWGQALDRTRDPARLVLVAAARDGLTMGGSPLVYVEHGAGQTYDGDPATAGDTSYAGGRGHERVVLFLCPNAEVADRWRVAYPATRAEVVGCPKLDPWHRVMGAAAGAGDPAQRAAGEAPAVVRPTVAVTFHWDCGLVPETRSAWMHYDHRLPALAADLRWQLLGHGHPRLWPTIRGRWSQLGVPHTAELADVLDQADVLVGDNSSALYEFASLGRPVVVLNLPAYRRHVHHGLRFWSHPPGLQVDRPAELADTIATALTDPPAAQRMRAAAVQQVYAHTDGHAAERAATAIMEVHRCLTPTPLSAHPAPR